MAASLHAVALAVVVPRARVAPPPSAAVEAPATELEIVLLEAPAVDADERGASAGEASDARGVPRVARRAPLAIAPIAPTAAAEAASEAKADGSSSDGYAVDPRARAADGSAPQKGVSFALPWMGAGAGEGGGEPPPARGPAGPRVDDAGDGLRRSLAREQADRDRKIGLGPGSEVANVAIGAVRQAGAPDGWAVVDVELDGAGNARAVSLAQSDIAGWQPAVDAIRAALAARSIKLPPKYRGARVRIKLTARFRLPNGQKSQVELVRPFEGADEPGRESPPPEGPAHTRWWKDVGPKEDARVLRRYAPNAGDAVPERMDKLVLPLFKWDPANIGAKKTFVVGAVVMDVVPM